MSSKVLTFYQSFCYKGGGRKLGGYILRKAAEKIMSQYSRLLNGKPIEAKAEEKKPEPKAEKPKGKKK